MATKPKRTHASETHRPTSSANPPISKPSRLNLPDIPFATVIEADHTTLSTLARSIFNPTHTPTTRQQLLLTLLWRLIRHDISEELVMRPAFARYMGDEGVRLAEHDRQDHAGLKIALVGLARRLENNVGVEQGAWMGELEMLSRDMAEHMREESGVVIPRFVALVGEQVGLELGRKYVLTLALTPETGERDLRMSDVLEYAGTDVQVLRGVLEGLERRAEDGVNGGYLQEKLMKELDRLRLCVDPVCKQSDKSRGKL